MSHFSTSSRGISGRATVPALIFGVILLGAGLLTLALYPVLPWLLLFLGLVLAIAQWRYPPTWLLAVPVILGCLDLGAWSGRLLWNERDGLLALLLGAAWMSGRVSIGGSQIPPFRWGLGAMWVAFAVSLGVGLDWRWPEANDWNGYLTGWNAVRIAKGPLWACLFLPLLLREWRQNSDRTAIAFSGGVSYSILGFGLWVLWERGFFMDLATAQNMWGLVGRWLDLSGSYRITGPFSQMHLGGEAVDAFLVLSWPFAAWLLVRNPSRHWQVVAFVALALSAYALIVTFTRITYAAIGLGVVGFAMTAMLPIIRRRHQQGEAIWPLIVSLTVLPLLAFAYVASFKHGGIYTTIALNGLLLSAFFVPGWSWLNTRRLPSVIALMGVAAACVAWMVRAMLSSKWVETPLYTALILSVATSAVVALWGYSSGGVVRRVLGGTKSTVVALCVPLLLTGVTLSLSNYQIGARFETVDRDTDTRLDHWQSVLSKQDKGWGSVVWGSGLGQFPRLNLVGERREFGAVWYFSELSGETSLWLLGVDELHLAQRVDIGEAGSYRVIVRAKSTTARAARLVVKLQPRRLLEASRWQPNEVKHVVEIASGDDWQLHEFSFDVSQRMIPQWYDPKRMVFSLSLAGASEGAVAVKEVTVISPTGTSVIKNGDFEQGGDYWFAYNDFKHLSWHAKNFFVALYFSMGLMAACVLLCMVFSIAQSALAAFRGDAFSGAVATALSGFLLIGFTSTLLDVPGAMTLVLLLVGMGSAVNRKETDFVRR